MATKGFGTTIAGATTDTIGNITDFDLSGLGSNEIDITSMASDDGYEEVMSGIHKSGSMSVTVQYAKAAMTKLQTAADSGTAENWTITFADNSTWVGSGFLTDLGASASFDGIVTATMTIRFTGKSTFSAAA